MDAELLAAYRVALYRVDDQGYAFVLRVGEPSAALASCHADFGVTCSTFITACNPRSRPTERDANEAAMRRLERALDEQGRAWLKGVGAAPDASWEPEPSLLVPGLEADAALDLARAFDQHAIVWAGTDAVPRLVLA